MLYALQGAGGNGNDDNSNNASGSGNNNVAVGVSEAVKYPCTPAGRLHYIFIQLLLFN